MSTVNPLLAKLKLPGRVFSLPSKGLLYENNELFPTVNNGELQVKPMSALAEIKMRNADLLFSGRAIDEIIRECATDVKTPFQLFSKDVDALLCFLRIATYGQYFEVEVRHDCEKAKQHTVDIDLEKIVANVSPLTPEIIKKYTLTLSNGQVVQLTPMRYNSLIDILQLQKRASEITTEEVQELFLKNFIEIIDNIDGISDKEMIREWATIISPIETNQIKAAFEAANDSWGIKLVQTIKCPDCKKEYDIDVPVDPVSFFSV